MSNRAKSPSPSKRDPQQQKQNEETQQKAKEAMLRRQKKGPDFFSKYAYHIVIGGFIALVIVALATTFFNQTKKLNVTPVINPEEIAYHNSQNYNWKMGSNDMFNQWMLSDANLIINNQVTSKSSLPRCNTIEETLIIPDKYNFREQHKECAKKVWNQGNCSSSYSIASVGAISDRFCQQSEHNITETLSAQQLLTCDKNKTMGCQGGYVTRTLDVAKRLGLVSEKCLNYTPEANTTECNFDTCEKFKIADYCVTHGEEGLKREIYKNGPIIVVIPIYIDFLVYKEGTYEVGEGNSKFRGGQAVKVIGWDSDSKGNKYWLIENSWGESWGMQGIAHVAINQKSLQIEEYAIAPYPKLPEKEEKLIEEKIEDLKDQGTTTTTPQSEEATNQ